MCPEINSSNNYGNFYKPSDSFQLKINGNPEYKETQDSVSNSEEYSTCSVDSTSLNPSVANYGRSCKSFTFVETKPNPKDVLSNAHTLNNNANIVNIPVSTYLPFLNSFDNLASLASIELKTKEENNQIKLEASVNSLFLENRVINPAKNMAKQKMDEIIKNPSMKNIGQALTATAGAFCVLNAASKLIEQKKIQDVGFDVSGFQFGTAVKFGEKDFIKPVGVSFGYSDTQKTDFGSIKYGTSISTNFSSLSIGANVDMTLTESSKFSLKLETENFYNKGLDFSKKISFSFDSNF